MVEATLFTLIILLLTGAIWKQESYFVSPLSQQLLGLTKKNPCTLVGSGIETYHSCYMDEVDGRLKQCKLWKNTNHRI